MSSTLPRIGSCLHRLPQLVQVLALFSVKLPPLKVLCDKRSLLVRCDKRSRKLKVPCDKCSLLELTCLHQMPGSSTGGSVSSWMMIMIGCLGSEGSCCSKWRHHAT